MPRYLISFLLFGWAVYYFIKETNFKQLKLTLRGFLKGIVFTFLGLLASIFITLSCEGGDVSSERLDSFLSIPVIIFTIIKIAKILNERDKSKKEKRE